MKLIFFTLSCSLLALVFITAYWCWKIFNLPHEQPQTNNKTCVMCHGVLTTDTESANYKGAHEWCSTYY